MRLIYLTHLKKNEKFSSYFTCFIYFSFFFIIPTVSSTCLEVIAKWLSQNTNSFWSLIWIQECSTDASANRRRKKNWICQPLQTSSQTGVILHFQMFSCLLFSSSTENKMLLKSWPKKKAAIITCRPCGLLARPMWLTPGWLSLIFLSIFHQGWGEKWRGRGERTEGKWKIWRGRKWKQEKEMISVGACWEKQSTEMKCFQSQMTDLQTWQMGLNVYNLVNVLKISNFPV